MDRVTEQAFRQLISELPDDYQWTISEIAAALGLPRNTARYQVRHNMSYRWNDSGPLSYLTVPNASVKIWATNDLPGIMARQGRKRNAQTSK